VILIYFGLLLRKPEIYDEGTIYTGSMATSIGIAHTKEKRI